MRRYALIALVLASFGIVHCSESTPPAPGGLTVPPPAPPGPAPVARYSISGVAQDPWTRVGLPGVTVASVGPTRASTTTDAEGNYGLTNLSSGTYAVTFSKPSYRARTYQGISVFSDVTQEGLIALDVPTPVVSDLTGVWVGSGPYRDEPLWLTLIDNKPGFEGMYRDRTSWSRTISGRRDGNAVSLRIDLPGSFLSVEGQVDGARCLRGVIKNEALGGNFPITFARGVPSDCAR